MLSRTSLRKILLTLTMALLFTVGMTAQEQENVNGTGAEDIAADAAVEKADGAGDAESEDPESEAGESETDELSLFLKTLKIDIQTAGYYELVAWCRRLGLSEKGDTAALRKRLFDHYSVEEEVAGQKKGKKISITSARRSEYFTLEQAEEDYIVIEGGVVISIDDSDKGVVHSIQAERVVFNQTENLLTAEGNVTYTLTEEGKDETFTGDRITFSVDSWEGVFYRGISESEQDIDENAVVFRYYGNEIYRSEGDVITMKEGVITSSKETEPYYRIQARKLWVLAPGEWAILGASIFVGEIPVMYLPFFFKNRDKVFFHPALGFRTAEGFFLQTTIYLLGESKTQDNALSFLQIDTAEQEYQKKKLMGVYLRTDGEMSRREREQQTFLEKSESYIRLMSDLYSRLGLFAGIDIRFGQSGQLDDFAFSGGLARSRDIYLYGTDSYTPFWQLDDEIIGSRWNGSWLGAKPLPFRYMLIQSISLDDSWYDLSTNFEFYSDPYFSRDFLNRTEETDWQGLAGVSLDEEEETLSDTSAADDYIEKLNWYITGQINPDISILNPYVTTLSLNNLHVEMNWKTKDRNTEEIEGYNETDPGYVPAAFRSDYSFPEKKFFYPTNFVAPNLELSVAGTLFNWKSGTGPAGRKEDIPEAELPGRGLRPPFEQREKEENNKETPDGTMRFPGMKPDMEFPSAATWTAFSHKLTYSMKPSFTMDHIMDSDLWETQEDIDFAQSYSVMQMKGTSSLTYTASVFEKLFTVNDSLKLSGELQKYFNRGENLDDSSWTEYLETQYNANSLMLTNTAQLSVSPLFMVDTLKNSSVSYAIQTTLFDRGVELNDDGDIVYGSPSIPRYLTETLDWDEEFITSHKLSANLVWNVLDANQTLAVSYVLPPLNQKFSADVTLNTGPFSTTAGWELIQEEDETTSEKSWEIQPLSIGEKFVYDDYLSLSQVFDYSFLYSKWMKSTSTASLSFFEKKLSLSETFIFGSTSEDESQDAPPLFTYPYSNTTTLKVWWFSSTFIAKRTNLYELDLSAGWIQQEEMEFQPYSLQFDLDIAPEIKPFWKNRIDLDVDVNLGWDINLIQFTDNKLTFGLDFDFTIYRFLELSVGVKSSNTEMYRYFRGLSEKLDYDQPKSLFVDLLKSFNVFNRSHREDSSFNAESFSLSLVHQLRDWNLSVEYTGGPELKSGDDGIQYYDWAWDLSLYVTWNPIPEVRKKVIATEEKTVF